MRAHNSLAVICKILLLLGVLIICLCRGPGKVKFCHELVHELLLLIFIQLYGVNVERLGTTPGPMPWKSAMMTYIRGMEGSTSAVNLHRNRCLRSFGWGWHGCVLSERSLQLEGWGLGTLGKHSQARAKSNCLWNNKASLGTTKFWS